MVEELMSGACIVLEIRAQNAQAVFRDFCGPADPVCSECIFYLKCSFFVQGNCSSYSSENTESFIWER